MWLTRSAINRPTLISMVFAALVVVGLVFMMRMPVEQRPKVDFPFVTVVTVYQGAGPQEIETLITKPIEDAVSSVANLKNVVSNSQDGISVVSLEFELGTDLPTAAADVREKVDAIRNSLPQDADVPTITKADISSIPVMTIGMKGPLPARELRRLADDVVKDRLARVKGTASVAVSGGDLREIQVLVDKSRLAAYNLTIAEVAAAIRAENLNVPGGSIKQGRRDFAVRVLGEFQTAEDISRMRLHIPDRQTGGPGWNIPLSDLARVVDTSEDPDVISRLNGEPTVVLAVQKQTDANTVDVARGARRELEDLKRVLPPGVEFIIATDESEFVLEQQQDTYKELILAIVLVVIVIFLFLHSARATFIVSVAIPTSLIATFIPMSIFGFSLNFMTMLALSLAVGILVDDSIVVLENIDRHLKEGEPPREAALNGRAEIGLAAVTITLVDVVVFIPIAFMGGIVGQFFKSFGITVASATLFSLLVGFALTPMMASRFYKRETRERRGQHADTAWNRFWDARFARIDAALNWLDSRYRGVLAWSLDNRFLTWVIGTVTLTTIIITFVPPVTTAAGLKARLVNLVLFVGVLGGLGVVFSRDRRVAVGFAAAAAACTLFVRLPLKGEFIPELDRGRIAITVETPAGSSLAYTLSVVQRIERILKEFPEVEYDLATVGSGSAGLFAGGDTGPQYARVSVQLVDRGRRDRWEMVEENGRKVRRMVERRRGIEEIITDLRTRVARDVPGADIKIYNAESQQVGTAPIEMEIQGTDLNEMNRVAERIAAAMREVPGTRDIAISSKVGRPELQVVVDRDRAMDAGITTGQVAQALRTSIEGDTSSKFRVEGTEYNIRVQLEESDRATADSVRRLVVGQRNGAPVFLEDIADVKLAAAPTKIDRRNKQRLVKVGCYLEPGYDLTSVQFAVNRAIEKVDMETTTLEIGGTSRVQGESFGFIFQALFLAIILVYMLMAGLFESLFNPLVIMLSLPQAMVGALLMLVARGQSISIISMIGIIMLMGIVTKNAILLIDYTNTLRKRGLSRRDAILEAGPTRLRPILMTTVSLLAALLPTMFALSKGSEQRSPLATAVVGGLLVSTLLTLLVIPATYTLMEDLRKSMARGLKRILRIQEGA